MCCSLYLTLDQQVVFSVARITGIATSPLRPGSNVRNIQGIFRKLLFNQLLLMGRIFRGIFLHMQLFVVFLFHFFTEYSGNILQVRPHPKDMVQLKKHKLLHTWAPGPGVEPRSRGYKADALQLSYPHTQVCVYFCKKLLAFLKATINKISSIGMLIK